MGERLSHFGLDWYFELRFCHRQRAAGGKSGCTGLQAIGGDGTYYAQSVAQATAYFVAEQALFPGSKNVLILLLRMAMPTLRAIPRPSEGQKSEGMSGKE